MELILKKLKELEAFIVEQKLQIKEVLTLEEAAIFLCLSKSTLYKMTSRREIPFYNPGGKKIYFKKTELEQWVSNGLITSVNQMQVDTEEYLQKNNKSICI